MSEQCDHDAPSGGVAITHEQCVCGHWQAQHIKGQCAALKYPKNGNSTERCNCRLFKLWAGGGD